MRHAEIAKPPAETGENVLPRGHHVPVACGQRTDRHTVPAHHGQCDDRRGEERAEHQQALEKVRPANGVESAEERITHDNDGGGVHGIARRNAEHGFKERAARLDAACGIHGICRKEDDGADDLQGTGTRPEAVGEILRDRDRIAAHDRERAKPRRDENPAERIAEEKPDGDPGLPHTVSINGSGKPHQHPRAHVARARRKAGHPCAHPAPAEEVVLLPGALAAREKPYADTQHKHQIQHKHQKLR